jgi:hypothetical protein
VKDVEGIGRDLIEVLSRHLPWGGGTEENTKNLSQGIWFRGVNMNPGPTEYKAGLLTTRLRRSDKRCHNMQSLLI